MDREEFRRIQSRRSFFQECAGGIGIMALAQLLEQDGCGAVPEHEPAGAAEAALPAQGQERHLHVHGGRPEPARPVRSQAGAPEVERQAAAALDDQRPAPGLHQAERRRAGQPPRRSSSTARAASSFPTTSRTSAPAPTTSAWCAPCTPTRSTTTPASCCSSAAASRWAVRPWARGCCTAWAASRRTCRASWCSAPASAPAAELPTGRADFCPRPIRAWCSAVRATRCCISRTRRASRARCSAPASTC